MEFRSAGSIDEALAWLSEVGDDAQVLAGGTDVMIQHMRQEIDPSLLIYIGRLSELEGYAANGNGRFGSLTTHRMLATDPRIAAAFPALATSAATVGGWQTQQVGTLGGNLCNASPAADTVPPLLVADARVELVDRDGGRNLPLDEFLLGRRRTARRADELVSAITAEPVGPATGETYLKLGRRNAMEVAVAGLAVRLTVLPDGIVATARIAACSVGPRPYRATEAERVLEGSRLEDEAVAEAGKALADAAQPIDDARASAAYRLRILPGLLARAVADSAARAEGATS